MEILDWGGSGKACVLLPGLAETAHAFDEFAPKLAVACHVYAITRRGFGASSRPAVGYSADRLAGDVISVIMALRLSQPVLIGHSIGGSELSTVGTKRPDLIGGLVYLDAGYFYAYDSEQAATWGQSLDSLLDKLQELKKGPTDPKPLVKELLDQRLPEFEKQLKGLLASFDQPRAPAPSDSDRSSFGALRNWFSSVQGTPFPESELRQRYEANTDGTVGKAKYTPGVARQVQENTQRRKQLTLRLPVLAIYASPHNPGPWARKDPSLRDTFAFTAAQDQTATDAIADAFQKAVPTAHVLKMRNASHLIYLSNEEEVLRELRGFLATIP